MFMKYWSTGKRWDKQAATQIAQVHKLGTVLREYRLSPYLQPLLAIISSMIMLVFIFLLPFIQIALPLKIVGEGGLFLALLAIIIPSLLFYKPEQITCMYHCTEGIIYIHQDQVETWHWDQVEEVRATFQATATRNSGLQIQMVHYAIRLDDGRDINGDWIGRINDLRFTLEDRLVRRLQPELARQFNSGQAIKFGQISINEQGISVHDDWRTLAWSELGHIEAKIDGLIITKAVTPQKEEAWASVPTTGMPNLCVCIALLRSIVGTKVIEYTWYGLPYW